jgi:hypothetical protein
MREDNIPITLEITLEQFCRALAAHLLLGAHPHLLQEFMAPETAEKTADFIYKFALGESVNRPAARPEDTDYT